MAKSTYLLALFVAVVVCAEAIRIDIPERPARRGRFISKVKTNDPRCTQPTGRFADPEDCTRYIKCVNGRSQERKCPGNMKFDSKEHCTYNKNADCGKSPKSGPLDDDVSCPDTYGMYPVKSDCHKYMVCTENRPEVRECPEGYYYSDINSGCIKGECPNQEGEKKSVCVKRDQVLPDKENHRSYIKCVNFKDSKKECPPGKAFDPRKLTCTKEYLKKYNNSVLNVLQDQ